MRIVAGFFFSFALLLTVFVFPPHGARAEDCATGAGGFVPLTCFQDSPRLRDAYSQGDLGTFMNRVFVGAIALGAILAVLRIAWAGFEYIGSDMWSKKDHAKEIMRETLLGLFILLAIWVILNQINPDILKLRVDVKTGTSSALIRHLS